MSKIRTVLGDIESNKLGFTYSHEHLIAVPPLSQKDRDFELSDYDKSLQELKSFKAAGGESLVDASTIDYGRNAALLKNMAIESGVNVICTTGFNKYIYFPDWVAEKSIDEITEMLVKDVTVGIDDTDVRAGFLKSGSYYNFIHPLEEKVTIAVAKAQVKTGAPVWLHTEAGTMGNEMLDILEQNGVDLKQVVVGHTDRNCDPYYMKSLIKRGASIQFDGCGKIKYYPDYVRVQMLQILKENNMLDHVLISGDMGRQSYLKAYGGGPGFEYIIKKFIPRLLDEGFTKEELDMIFYTNPERWLAKF